MTPSRHTNSRTRTNRVAGKQLATGEERGGEGGIKEEEKGEKAWRAWNRRRKKEGGRGVELLTAA